MAQKIVVELTEQLRMTQKGRIAILLDPDASPEQNEKATKALRKAGDALLDAINDDLRDGQPKVKALTAKIKKNTDKIEEETAGLKRAVALVKLFAEVIRLSAEVMKVVA